MNYMNYVVTAALLWAVFFTIATLIHREKSVSAKEAAFIGAYPLLGVICMYFVIVVLLVVKMLL